MAPSAAAATAHQGLPTPAIRAPFPTPRTTEALAERVTLSAFDGAACELGVSREEVTLAITTKEELGGFAEKHDLDDTEVESALRAGILRAIDDAERANAIDATAAVVLGAAARALRLAALVDKLRDPDQLAQTLSKDPSAADSCQPRLFTTC